MIPGTPGRLATTAPPRRNAYETLPSTGAPAALWAVTVIGQPLPAFGGVDGVVSPTTSVCAACEVLLLALTARALRALRAVDVEPAVVAL
jgi:hypothetical protein